jgi:heme/copper-type cytochrome/quinol oxidase subunit 2
MIATHRNHDRVLLLLLLLLSVAIPVFIAGYDRQVWFDKVQPQTRMILLTGNIDRGWVNGDIKAYEAATLSAENLAPEHPVIRVKKGEKVVFKLTSSDVIHGFSLKDFEVYVEEGIYPGKVMLVSFIADKTGTFTFTCNAICGKNHEKMQGTLVVEA